MLTVGIHTFGSLSFPFFFCWPLAPS
uniref:Mlo8 n=1 Tax=Arundo donax TaxID=35708 RepID=A0A0A8Y127_ARUDO